jgi:hypothetical protein
VERLVVSVDVPEMDLALVVERSLGETAWLAVVEIHLEPTRRELERQRSPLQSGTENGDALCRNAGDGEPPGTDVNGPVTGVKGYLKVACPASGGRNDKRRSRVRAGSAPRYTRDIA